MAKANPIRILTHKKQRKLSDGDVHALLTAYIETDTTYNALSKRYDISTQAVSRIIRGFTYREVPGITDLRRQAQAKAAERNSMWTKADVLRVPDAAKMVIEVDPHSADSVCAAMHCLQTLLSSLIGEADSAQTGDCVTVNAEVQPEEVPFSVNAVHVGLIGTEDGVPFS